jgi:predicted DCC family thiol-disulfide oxidoreductase YuxK
MTMEPVKHIVIFDGVCKLCNSFVNFLIRKNSKNNLRFITLQEVDQLSVMRNPLQNKKYDSVIFVSDGIVYEQAEAVLKIMGELDGIMGWLKLLNWIPKNIQNSAYRLFAKNRYRWFGKFDSCILPTQEVQARFISPDELVISLLKKG